MKIINLILAFVVSFFGVFVLMYGYNNLITPITDTRPLTYFEFFCISSVLAVLSKAEKPKDKTDKELTEEIVYKMTYYGITLLALFILNLLK